MERKQVARETDGDRWRQMTEVSGKEKGRSQVTQGVKEKSAGKMRRDQVTTWSKGSAGEMKKQVAK